jgi:hypothetical protein
VRCPILIGRQEPAALIVGAVRRLSGPGRGGALVVAGQAGIGKSRLAEHTRAVAAQFGVPVVTGRAMPAGIGGTLGPFAEVILELTRGRSEPDDEDLAPYLAVLASVVPRWRRPGWSAPAEPVLVTAEAVLQVLRWATEGQGVAVVLEDLHWADDATLAVTRYLADHADDVPLALLATVRTGEGRDDAAAVLAVGDAAFAAGDFASAELLLREAGQISGIPVTKRTPSISETLKTSEVPQTPDIPNDLRISVAARLAQVLLQVGQPAEAGRVAAQTVAVADGRDPAAATAMRLVQARAAAMTARWDDARAQLAEVRRSAAADPATAAEIALVEAQAVLGVGRAGSRAAAEHLAAEAVGIATGAGRQELVCEALETLGSCARLRDLDAAAAAFRRALDSAAASNLPVHRLRILNELGTVEMLRDARGERLEQARAEALRVGAVGLAVGIGANIAALLAMTARFGDVMEVAGEVERSARRLGLVPVEAAALLMQGFASRSSISGPMSSPSPHSARPWGPRSSRRVSTPSRRSTPSSST